MRGCGRDFPLFLHGDDALGRNGFSTIEAVGTTSQSPGGKQMRMFGDSSVESAGLCQTFGVQAVDGYSGR
jgi:hypothetical protein